MKCKTLEEAKQQWPEIPMGTTKMKIGDSFNRLTLIQRTHNRSNRPKFVFKCVCGNYICAASYEVSHGRTKSCGCLNKEINSKKLRELKLNKPANNREQFEYLQEVGHNGFKFIRDRDDYKKENKKIRYAEFLCPLCSQSQIGRVSNVKHDLVKSCGCTKKDSFGVIKIKKILNQNHILFQTEYTFEDCKNEKLLPFDFQFQLDNQEYIIEFDGSQHFLPKWGEEELKQVQKRDKIKNNYCISKGIKLYRIPYTDEEKINTLSDLLDDKYLVKIDSMGRI